MFRAIIWQARSADNRVVVRQPGRWNAGGGERGQRPVPQRLPNDTRPLPAARGNENPLRKYNHVTESPQAPGKEYILHERHVGEAAGFPKGVVMENQSLIPVRQGRQPYTVSGTGVDGAV